jgi:hypothetical protein
MIMLNINITLDQADYLAGLLGLEIAELTEEHAMRSSQAPTEHGQIVLEGVEYELENAKGILHEVVEALVTSF